MRIAWVVGAGGLLGGGLAATLRESGTEVYSPAQRFDWTDAERLASQVTAAVTDFAGRASSRAEWEIYWAAGVGTMRSPGAVMVPEMRALALLLERVEGSPVLRAIRGRFCLASSAGAIHAGSTESTITEDSEPRPTTPYAEAKLEQERLVQGFVQRMGGNTTALLARISTVFGPGQSRSKSQGLISHIARQIVQNRPVHIFVPLDTIRDYISVEDATTRLVAAGRAMERGAGASVRIVASESPTTIAEIVSIFRRLSRRRPPVVTSASRDTAAYTRCVQFRSSRQVLDGVRPPEPLPLGIARVLATERRAHASGN